MHVFTNFSFRQLLVSLGAPALLLCSLFTTANANIDWGGGVTQFYGEDGAALTTQTGCAALIAVSEGKIIDFSRYIPEQPEDLLRVGAELREGDDVNRVIAQSGIFYSGYLLYSAIPDLTASELAALGVAGGERLYLVVWDRRTFVDGSPTDRSFYTVQPLYNEGAILSQAVVPFSNGSVYAQVTYPASDLTEDQTLSIAERAGHNAFSGFADWAENSFGIQPEVDADTLRLLDSNMDGRSNFEEYLFRARPQLAKQVAAADNGMGGDTVEGDVPVPGAETLQFVVELRANDPSLVYTAHASGDLSAWLDAELSFDGGDWRSSSPALAVTTSVYSGLGLWTVALQYQPEDDSDRCFYKMSADEIEP